ncbi:hypothetical protein BO79DRAFT_52198 [Aspergillus costaricaensis CBS 115574]|uniref:Uncharacterized protein n=1 Tax=Aspergillus costaricaensis CBS 115574 TaxID=1448317 RepID=A0ACD1I2C0_9EURO|nr:hypothetical protein BO79DRAFT_52198 [Aspergillus costaricaensis CBS 115574]RAK84686.1 hypothetical protein BO79DRAFT_52198 [Aspergillus costaricaensis CBS 115574]
MVFYHSQSLENKPPQKKITPQSGRKTNQINTMTNSNMCIVAANPCWIITFPLSDDNPYYFYQLFFYLQFIFLLIPFFFYFPVSQRNNPRVIDCFF